MSMKNFVNSKLNKLHYRMLLNDASELTKWNVTSYKHFNRRPRSTNTRMALLCFSVLGQLLHWENFHDSAGHAESVSA